MVNLTVQDTTRLIGKMRALYGRKFDQQWAGVDPQMLAETFAEGLQGLTGQELACGMNALMRHDWPPTVPEFRRMCQPIDLLDREWDTPEVAWAKAVQNLDEMTTFSTCDQIQQAWGVASKAWPDKYAARKAFCDSYERLVVAAKAQGVLPVWWISLGQEAATARATAIQHAVDLGQVGVAYKADAVAMLEQSKPMASSVSDHLANLKAMFSMDDESLAEKQARIDAEMQERKQRQIEALKNHAPMHCPDPFLNTAEYFEMMRVSGREVPQWIADMASGAA
jgi:hypothetical protein